MIFKFRFQEGGAHTHVQLYAGESEGALGRCGSFAMRNEEWKLFKEILKEGVNHDGPVNCAVLFHDENRLDRIQT